MADDISVDRRQHRPVLRAERYTLDTRLSYEECITCLRSRLWSRRDVPLRGRAAPGGKVLTGRAGIEGFSVRLRERWFRQNTNPYRPCARGHFVQAAPGTRIEVRIDLGAVQVVQLLAGLVFGAFYLIVVSNVMWHVLAHGPGRWWGGLAVALFLALSVRGWRRERRKTLADRDRLLAVVCETLNARIAAACDRSGWLAD